MTKPTTVRLPDEAEAVARIQGTSVNQLIARALTAEIEKVRADADFTSRATKLIAAALAGASLAITLCRTETKEPPGFP